MKFGETPRGCAGADQVNALDESINAQIEAMFTQVAKRRILEYGVGRTTMTRSGADAQRLDAQRRECDGSIMFHAGRAMELALHVLYARGMDRILGARLPRRGAETGPERSTGPRFRKAVPLSYRRRIRRTEHEGCPRTHLPRLAA